MYSNAAQLGEETELSRSQQTQFDLHWRMFGIDVRVQPFLGGRLGPGLALAARREIRHQRLLLWVAVLFVSILIHELGHVCMGRVFGTNGHILIHGLGGLAIGASNLAHRGRQIAVYLAGPFAGFLLVGLLVLGLLVAWRRIWCGFVGQNLLALVGLADAKGFPELYPVVSGVLQEALSVNVFWGLFNLLPSGRSMAARWPRRCLRRRGAAAGNAWP